MQPRPVFEGTIYLITRRCAERRLFLQPSALVTQVVVYCLAVAAMLYGVKIHAVCVMGSHIHLVVTDPKGNIPKFMHWFDMMVARFLNAKRKRNENFWKVGTYNRPAIVDPDDVLRKMVYVLTNPVEARLVPIAAQWPGYWSGTLRHGIERVPVKKPKLGDFFKSYPEEMTLVIERPEGFEHLSGEEFGDLLHEKFEAEETEIRERVIAEHEESGRGGPAFLGMKGVRKRNWWDSAVGPEQFAGLVPNVIAGDKQLRLRLIDELKVFREQYHQARKLFERGHHDVEFPPGTYWMKLHGGAKVREPP